MQFAVTYGCIGALAVVACAWRLVLAARAPHAPARWAVAISIACAATGFEAAVPPIYEWIGRASGIPNLASLIVYSAITTAVLSQLVWTAYLVEPDAPAAATRWGRARTVMLVNAAVVAVMTLLFAAAPVHDRVHATDFDYHYATAGLVDAFLAVYLIAYTAGLLRIAQLCRAWLPQTREQPWLRNGLVLLGIGSLIAVGYSVGKAAAITAAWADIDAFRLNTEIAPAFASLGAAVMLIGYLCPSLIPQAVGVAYRVRALPRLHPLWSDLRAAAPELSDAAPVTRRPTRDRVYRRVIEIRDTLLLLQPHLTPEITARAELLAAELDIPAADRPAAIEAARIAAALQAHRSGAPAVDLGETFRHPPQPTVQGELTWLVAVATAYHRSKSAVQNSIP
ncbi:MAB_1171c family putative transporter [Nocardia inohanensis]|uniref:MAB_1171c family putative transporter n=1 Tax=Nocardia inohanensis TaxID=209246 RepID=UPI00083185C7|nr:MAB_1171c family putative transporter [Nocardia inohanensis]